MPTDLTVIAQVISVVVALVGGVWALLKLVVSQFKGALDERFAAMEKAREEGRRLFEARFMKLEEGHLRVERDLLAFKLDVAESRVHREDYVRNQTLIEAKLDGMATKMENWFLRMRQG